MNRKLDWSPPWLINETMKRREKTRENTITSQSLMASVVSVGPVSVSNSVLYIFILYNIYTVLKPRCCHGVQVQHVEFYHPRVFRHLLPVKALKGMPSWDLCGWTFLVILITGPADHKGVTIHWSAGSFSGHGRSVRPVGILSPDHWILLICTCMMYVWGVWLTPQGSNIILIL